LVDRRGIEPPGDVNTLTGRERRSIARQITLGGPRKEASSRKKRKCQHLLTPQNRVADKATKPIQKKIRVLARKRKGPGKTLYCHSVGTERGHASTDKEEP